MASTRTTSISSVSSVDSHLSVSRHQTIDCPSLRQWLDKEAQRQWEEWYSSTLPKGSQTETDLGTIFGHAPQPTSSPSECSIDTSSSVGEPHSPQFYTDEQAWLSVHCAAKGPMAPPPPSPKILPASQLRPTPNESLANERNRSRCESLTSARGTHEDVYALSGASLGTSTASLPQTKSFDARHAHEQARLQSGYVSFYDIEDLGRPLTQEEEEQLAEEGDGSHPSGWLSRVVRGLSFTGTASA